MSLILKIAAGVVIGILFIQVLNLKTMEYGDKKDVAKYTTIQNLATKSIVIENALKKYLRSNGKLTADLNQLNCHPWGECTTVANVYDGFFYINHNKEWMVISPYLAGGEINFHCKATLIDYNNPAFSGCTEMTDEEKLKISLALK